MPTKAQKAVKRGSAGVRAQKPRSGLAGQTSAKAKPVAKPKGKTLPRTQNVVKGASKGMGGRQGGLC